MANWAANYLVKQALAAAVGAPLPGGGATWGQWALSGAGDDQGLPSMPQGTQAGGRVGGAMRGAAGAAQPMTQTAGTGAQMASKAPFSPQTFSQGLRARTATNLARPLQGGLWNAPRAAMNAVKGVGSRVAGSMATGVAAPLAGGAALTYAIPNALWNLQEGIGLRAKREREAGMAAKGQQVPAGPKVQSFVDSGRWNFA